MTLAKLDPNLLTDQAWTGTFYPPGREDLAFGGELCYSPTEGLKLKFAISTSRDLGCDIRFLHGETSNGTPCTLVGSFEPKKAGFSMQNGYSYCTANDGYPFSYVLFGAHVEDSTTFGCFQFDFTGSQHYFAPESSNRQIPFSREILFSAVTDLGIVEVFHTGSFDFAPNDLRAFLHGHDEIALSKLQSSYEAIKAEHPQFFPFLKKTLAFSFHLKIAPESKVNSALKACLKVANLFSILRFSPTRLSHVWAIASDESGQRYSLPVLPSMIADGDTIKRSLSDTSYHDLPLTMMDFDFSVVLYNWLKKHDDFDTVTSAIQSQGRTVSPHDALSSIVLIATQLEGIGHQAGQVKDRFGFSARKYSSEKLIGELASLLTCSEQCIGIAISDLRNEIAHVGRPKKYLARLNSRQKYKVARLLELVVLGYLLEEIGVSTTSRKKYQDNLIW